MGDETFFKLKMAKFFKFLLDSGYKFQVATEIFAQIHPELKLLIYEDANQLKNAFQCQQELSQVILVNSKLSFTKYSLDSFRFHPSHNCFLFQKNCHTLNLDCNYLIGFTELTCDFDYTLQFDFGIGLSLLPDVSSSTVYELHSID